MLSSRQKGYMCIDKTTNEWRVRQIHADFINLGSIQSKSILYTNYGLMNTNSNIPLLTIKLV